MRPMEKKVAESSGAWSAHGEIEQECTEREKNNGRQVPIPREAF
jgi:hypothetical protein